MNSLRWKLFVGSLLGFTLLLGIGGTVAYFCIKDRLYAAFDRGLAQRAVSLIPMIKLELGAMEIEWLEYDDHPPGHQEDSEYYSIWMTATGETLAASRDLEDNSLPRFGGALDNPPIVEVLLPGDRAGRCVGIEFRARVDMDDEQGPALKVPEGPFIQLVIARVDTVRPTLSSIRSLFMAIWSGGTVLSAVVIWFIVRQNLRPLDRLRRQIGLKEAVSGQRIVLPGQPAELEPVTRELNRLLDRVDRALVRERTLTSNVTHELRTPLAGILSTLEVSMSRTRSAEESRETIEECFEIAKRMHWLVFNLLSITRIEANHVQLESRSVAMDQSLTEWWEPFARRAQDRSLQVDWEIAPGAKLETDPGFLRVVVTNLFDNAVSYAAQGGTIRITADALGNITVTNPSEDLNSDVVEHIFDPFWRNTESREVGSGHVGLGLNLSMKIVELLGGRITAQVEESTRLFIIRVQMAAPVPQPHPA